MGAVLEEAGFEGSTEEYLNYLATAPEFYFDDPNDLLEGYQTLTGYIRDQLPNLFGMIPDLPFEVVPVPAYSQEGQVAAYYQHGSVVSNRPGRFFVNTFDLSTRPKWQMESLSLHEAVPGHHFQLSLVQELEGLSEFRIHYNSTAYIEGWGLYTESLGPDFGLSTKPETRFGRLIEEMMRAVRLVVDTGIHEFGWSRDEAIAYMMYHTGFSERESATEIDRYSVMPGQALAYKVGELSIQRWKREAKEMLGERFDIRAFHDTLLGNGTLPLDLCEEIMHSWMQSLAPAPELSGGSRDL
jgi:prolyl oligopeptidase